MAQSVFGVGFLFETPAGSNPTPTRFGRLQDVSVDFSYDAKLLYGSNQYALEMARGKAKITVAALTARVALLEGQMRALDELKLDVARPETRLDALIEHVRDLAASIRWMREPGGRRVARTPG